MRAYHKYKQRKRIEEEAIDNELFFLILKIFGVGVLVGGVVTFLIF